MILPTQDKELIKDVIKIVKDGRCLVTTTCNKCEANNTELCSAYAIMDSILKICEWKGYHVGLPPSIEEALNSGDGTYKP